jgi:hypothetical protein
VVYLHSVGEASFPHEPPPNDTVQGAVSIPTFPGADYADTTYASTEPIDDALNAGCGAPATEASVWFALPGLTFEPVLIDTTASSYSTTILLATGTPDALTLVACGHGTLTVPFPARAWVAVVDDVPGGTNGGSLVLAIGDPNAPSINLSVDSVGGFDAATGVATLRGTTTCSGIGVADDLFGTARQDRGRPSAVEGGFRSFTPIPCDGLPHRWSHEVFPNPGDKFTGGPAKVSVVEFACFDYFVCRATRVDRTVYLRS